MNILDFYKVISDDVKVEIYGRDEEIKYFYGKISDVPIKYLGLVVRHIAALYIHDKDDIEYIIYV